MKQCKPASWSIRVSEPQPNALAVWRCAGRRELERVDPGGVLFGGKHAVLTIATWDLGELLAIWYAMGAGDDAGHVGPLRKDLIIRTTQNQ